MNLTKIIILSVLVTAFSLNQTKANTYTYNFIENDGGSGVTGTITLDSAANSAGSVADILGISFFDSNDNFSYTFNPLTESLILDSPVFSWTSAGITQMNIGIKPNDSDYYYEAVYDNGLWYGGLDEAIGGSWLAAGSAVPDTASTLVLSALAFGALVCFQSLAKISPLAVRK